MQRLVFIAPLCFALFACDGNILEGDWFACEDLACVELDNQGIRFDGDETWVPLAAPGSRLEPGELYCHLPISGSYSVEESTLTLRGFEAITGGSSQTKPSQDFAPAQTCQADEECGTSSFCSNAGICELRDPPPDPEPEPRAEETLTITFEMLEDRASFTVVGEGDSMLMKRIEHQDTLSCPSDLGGDINLPRPSDPPDGTSSGGGSTGSSSGG
jgi:hypothetical protein